MRIHAIETGRVRIKSAQIEGRGHGMWRQLQPMLSRQWAEWVPVFAWAIEHDEGVIVIDTGSAAHLKSLPRWHPYFRLSVQFDIEAEQEIGPKLRRVGINAQDVKIVVLTHLHIDHDGGLAHFPHSRILASAEEVAATAGFAGTIKGYLPKRWPSWFEPEPIVWRPSRSGPFTRSAAITKSGDVFAIPTPGHTPNHVSVVAVDGDKQIMFAGDASYLESTMLRGAIDGVSPDEHQSRQTLAEIRDFCTQRPTVYLPAHDPNAAGRLNDRCTVALSHSCGEADQTCSAANWPPSATTVVPVM